MWLVISGEYCDVYKLNDGMPRLSRYLAHSVHDTELEAEEACDAYAESIEFGNRKGYEKQSNGLWLHSASGSVIWITFVQKG